MLDEKGVVTVQDQGGKSSAARQLKLEDAYDANNSPVPPILRTPGIQQISTRSAVEKQQIGKMDSSGADSQMELPRTPEMTYSLKVISVFNFTITVFTRLPGKKIALSIRRKKKEELISQDPY